MKENTKTWALTAIFIGVAIISFLIVKPYALILASSCILAYISFPVYRYIYFKLKNKKLSSLITIIAIILIVLIPSILILNSLVRESVTFYGSLSKYLSSEESTKQVTNYVYEKLGVTIDLPQIAQKATETLVNFAGTTLQEIPKRALEIFILLVITYYLLIHSEEIKEVIKKYIPVQKDKKEKLVQVIESVTSAVVFGTIMTAVIQGIIATVGYTIFQAPNPFLLGILTIISALLPFIGTMIVWVPVSAFMIINGVMIGSALQIGLGIGLILYGIFIISTIDNFVRPYLISGKTHIHPLIILLGVIGGVNLFGFVGLFLGPIILALFTTLFEMHEHFLEIEDIIPTKKEDPKKGEVKSSSK